MKSTLFRSAEAGVLSSAAAMAWAHDIEGTIERIDAANRSLTVQGIPFHTTAATDYDEGLRRFEDLRIGQRVEVGDGRHTATGIELDD